jgi:hypothetical protein
LSVLSFFFSRSLARCFSFIYDKLGENLPNIHKNKALKKGGEKGTRWVDPSPSKKNETTNQGGSQGEQDQIKYSTLPRRKEHMR